jgi:hypothetical protein
MSGRTHSLTSLGTKRGKAVPILHHKKMWKKSNSDFYKMWRKEAREKHQIFLEERRSK